jgi:hypothetical protein
MQRSCVQIVHKKKGKQNESGNKEWEGRHRFSTNFSIARLAAPLGKFLMSK